MRIPNATPASLKSIIETWPECDEYISKSPCRVTVNMSNVAEPETTEHAELMPHAHWDVQVKPFVKLKAVPTGEAAVYLTQGSPFMKCTVAAVPAAPTRDLSANIGSLLTAVAGIGAPQKDNLEFLSKMSPLVPNVSVTKRAAELISVDDEIETAMNQVNNADQDIPNQFRLFRNTLRQYWKFSFANDEDASVAIKALTDAAASVLGPLDDFTKLGGTVSLIDAEVTRLGKAGKTPPSDLVNTENNLIRLKARVDLIKSHIANLGDQQKLVVQLRDFLATLTDHNNPLYTQFYTTQALPMAYFSGKSATETITCKDAITKDQVFDNVVFTAYYEALPHLDVSVGAIGSLLGGRQVGTFSDSYTPQAAAMCSASSSSSSGSGTGSTGSTTMCGPQTVLGYTSKSSYQFMPGVFVEWRWKNFHCPWVENGAPWHPLGYVCSIGAAGGVAINPNNGGPAAEFFEGLSIGVQRFAVLIGVHNGRYQEFGGGYYVGEVFQPGTTVMPPTAYRWATHPAFAIAYRIPIR